MNHNWHTKHFAGAFKTLRRSGTLLAVAPLGIIVGMGALIDSTIVMLQIVFTSPPFPHILSNLPTIGLVVVIALLSMVAQNTIIINTYKRATMKRMPGLAAIPAAANLMLPTAAVHIVTISVAGLIVFGLSAIYSATSGAAHPLMQVLISIIGGGLLMTLFTIKTLTLHSVVGAGKSLGESARSTVNMLRNSLGLIVEHNVVLFIINIFALIIIFTITSIILFVLSGIGITASQFFGGTSSLFLSTAIATFINLVMMGALMLYNMAAWSELTRNLRRRALPSAMRHLAKTYLPF